MNVLRCFDGIREFEVLPSPHRSCGFRELGSYVFVADHAERCELFVDEVPLALESEHTKHRWIWRPGFFAGEVRAELVDPFGRQVAEYQLDVSPDDRKLGRELYDSMVDELLATDSRLLFGDEAAQHEIGDKGDFANPHLQYARLRVYGPKLIAALRQIASSPLKQLALRREWRPLPQLRKIDQLSILSLMRDPVSLGALRGNAQTNGSQCLQVDVPVSHEIVDTPANRTMHWFLRSTLHRVRSVGSALDTLARRESESTRTPLAPRMPYRLSILSSLQKGLQRLERSAPFSSTTRSELSAAGLNAISAHPLYARASQLAWHILRPGMSGESIRESLWMIPTWEIFERWSYLKACQSLEAAYPRLTWSYKNFGSAYDSMVHEGASDGMTIQVFSQAECPAGDRPMWHDFGSLSGTRYPDIVVTYETSERRAFLVLDAKYRTSREGVLEGMTSAHVYRDCLRWREERPRAVYVLVPALGGAPWLETSDFRSEHGVGVVRLCDRHELQGFGAIARELFEKPK